MQVESGPGWELRCGDYRETLADVERCDAVITDPPYSERTHKGALDATTLVPGVGYTHWTSEDGARFVLSWSDRCAGWLVVHSDDVLGPVLRDTAEACGRYAFGLLPVLQQQPRVTGDGPAPFGHVLSVSRPVNREFAAWGSLPGWYMAARDGSIVRGGKPVALLRKIVRDYSRAGDLIVDPCAGGGTTLLAAVLEGRRALGAELDPETFRKAAERLRKYAPLFETQDTGIARAPRMRQQKLCLG